MRGNDNPQAAFSALIVDAAASATRIADFLDGLAPAERAAASTSLGRSLQRQLWHKVEGAGALTLEDFVPAGTPVLTAVRHCGRNTLPAFTRFEKRFYRTSDGKTVAGANFQAISPFTGPGYFVCVENKGRGEVDVDYRQVPSEAPAGWPKLQDNEGIPSRFIYGFMVDSMRRVSAHVTIGSAARHGHNIGSWFTLCREASR